MRYQHSPYTFVRDLTPRESSTSHRVGLYSFAKGLAVIKRHTSQDFDIDCQNMLHESQTLKMLAKIKHTTQEVCIPQFISYDRSGGKSELVMTVVPGNHLDAFTSKIHVNGLSKVLNFLEECSKKISNNDRAMLPYRSPLWYLMRICFYGLKEIVRNPLQSLLHAQLITRALWEYICVSIRHFNPIFTHGGLYSDSILFDQSNSRYALVDWESAHFAHPVAEVASIYIFHNKYIPLAEMKSILIQRISTRADLHMFRLVCTYLLLSLQKERSHFFKNSSLFECVKKVYSLEVVASQSPYERIHHLTFTGIARMFKLFPNVQSQNEPVILCYHSISDSGWRFATPIETFREHVTYLHMKHTIVPLEVLISGKAPKGSVAITFDDAYMDVFENAYPILKKIGSVGTVFALGSPERSRKDELENSFKMMTDSELLKLAQAGWEIGYHTDTHPDLQKLSDAQLVHEIVVSKNAMEKRLGLNVRYFAYPKGKYSTKITGIVKEGGYKAGFTVDGGKLSLKDSYAITRMPTEGVLSTEELDAQMSSLGLFVGQVYMSILILKDRVETLVRRYV